MKLKISYEESKHWRHIQNKKVILTIYLVLRILVVATMVAQFFNGNYENVMLCVLTLVLFMLPSFCERRLHIDLPDTLEVIVLLFIFSAEILGEIQEFYILIPGWDTVLHTLNGFLCAAIGFSIVNILNEDQAYLHAPFSFLHGCDGVLFLYDHRRSLGVLRVGHG